MAKYVYSKMSGDIVNCYPDTFTIEEFAKGNQSVYEAFDIMEYPDRIFPVNGYKVIDGLMVKTIEDKEYMASNYFNDKLNSLRDEKDKLKEENKTLKNAIAELSMLIGGIS